MPLPRVDTRVPTSLGRIECVLHDPTGNVAERYITATVAVLDQHGAHLENVTANITLDLTTAVRNALSTQMTNLRNYANGAVLPQ